MNRFNHLFWAALVILTGVRLILIGQFDLSPDEAYYWTWSRHLDWSYYDQGPMLALVIRLFTSLTGSVSAWSVRLGAVVLSVVSSWLFFVLVRRLFHSSRAAWFGFLAMQASLLFSAGALLMMHDSIMVCAWLGALLAFHRATTDSWTPGWILGSLLLGIGALAKYTMALFVPGLLLFLWLDPSQRHWWRRPHLYLTGLGVVLFILPMLIWNQQHGWASFGHIGLLGGLSERGGLSWKTAGDFLGGQLAVMTPVLGAFALASPFLAWRSWRRREAHAVSQLYLFCFASPTLLFFLLLSFTTQVYANWPAPAYPAALGILAGWLDRIWDGPRVRWRVWAWTGFTLAAGLTILVQAEAAWGILPLPGRAAHSMDRVRGWRELGAETGRQLAAWRAETTEPVFVAARRYQIASEISFYAPGQPMVQLLPLRPPAGNQYRFWDRADLLRGQNALFVAEDDWEREAIDHRFRRVEALPPFVIRRDGRVLRTILYFRAYDFQPENTP